MTDDIVIEHNPRAGPRWRVTYTPDPERSGEEYCYWRIEESYDTIAEEWHEVGRQHVSEPEVRIKRGSADAQQGLKR